MAIGHGEALWIDDHARADTRRVAPAHHDKDGRRHGAFKDLLSAQAGVGARLMG